VKHLGSFCWWARHGADLEQHRVLETLVGLGAGEALPRRGLAGPAEGERALLRAHTRWRREFQFTCEMPAIATISRRKPSRRQPIEAFSTLFPDMSCMTAGDGVPSEYHLTKCCMSLLNQFSPRPSACSRSAAALWRQHGPCWRRRRATDTTANHFVG
jgi:hypothetical protein